MTRKLTVTVPATCANLGPGFDSFGLAIDWRNRFEIQPADADLITSAQEGVPLSPQDNMVFEGIEAVYLAQKKRRPSLHLHIDATLPLARGLGSSSTAIVAGLVAANALLDNPYDKKSLAQMATEIEGHPDNVVPALIGGVNLCDGDYTVSLPWPETWGILVIVPPYPIRTDEAREVLPKAVEREDAIFNLRKASLLTYALLQQDAQAFSISLDDALHQPFRGKLIPEWESLQITAAQHALGSIISGSGPTMAVFYPKKNEASLLSALKDWQTKQPNGQSLIVRVSTIDSEGAKIL